MNLEILNKPEVDAFLYRAAQRQGATAIKGDAPEGATYDDGTPIVRPVNIGWEDVETAARIRIQYRQADEVVDWESVARWLYSIMDDIDTASDHVRGDDAKYREVVERLQKLRGEVGASFDGQTVTFRNPSEDYGLTRLWHPCTPRPWGK